jgi:23S rRNA (uridine2552-2'-O)-methyltransferase
MAYQPNDHYAKKAKAQDFMARSVFKLEELDQKFHLLRSGDKVLDLGASPGSWSQYAAQKAGKNGFVIGIDLTAIPIAVPNALFIQGDMLTLNLSEIIEKHAIELPFDAVISDMAPSTTGVKITDQSRSLELCEKALETAIKYLKVKGNFVCKIFDGPDVQEFRKTLRQYFTKVDSLRPNSTRKESKEVFIVGLGFKGMPSE